MSWTFLLLSSKSSGRSGLYKLHTFSGNKTARETLCDLSQDNRLEALSCLDRYIIESFCQLSLPSTSWLFRPLLSLHFINLAGRMVDTLHHQYVDVSDEQTASTFSCEVCKIRLHSGIINMMYRPQKGHFCSFAVHRFHCLERANASSTPPRLRQDHTSEILKINSQSTFFSKPLSKFVCFHIY